MFRRLKTRIKARLLRWIGHNAFQMQCDCGAGLVFFAPYDSIPYAGGSFGQREAYRKFYLGIESDVVVFECDECHLIYTLRWRGNHFSIEKKPEQETIKASELLAAQRGRS